MFVSAALRFVSRSVTFISGSVTFKWRSVTCLLAMSYIFFADTGDDDEGGCVTLRAINGSRNVPETRSSGRL